jgi:hypothetical protein
LPFSTTLLEESMTNSILPDEDLLDDDISCDTYSNSTYSSFWSMGAFRESPYSPNWSVNTVFSGSCNTSIWYVDTVSIDYRYSSIVSTDTCRDLDSSYSSIWSITSLGDLSDVFEDQEKTEKGFDDVKSILV